MLLADEMVAQMVLLDPAAIYENDDRVKEPRVIQVSPLRLRMVDHPGCKGCIFHSRYGLQSGVSGRDAHGTVTDDTQVRLALPFLSNPIVVSTIIFEIGDG